MNPVIAEARLAGVFIGQPQVFGPEGERSAIIKQRIEAPVDVTATGLVGDAQADRRVHGGAEKAVHYYPLEHYAVFRTAYPRLSAAFTAGSIGENLSGSGLTEAEVCIGDVFRIGSCVLQISQPRSPCWKIDHRYGIERLSRFVQERRIAGWYLRVLEPGRLSTGDSVERIEVGAGALNLVEFWDLYLQHRPSREAVQRMLQAESLNPEWRRRIEQRGEWLARHGG